MGSILMSERELHHVEVLSKVVERRMTLVSAAHVLTLNTQHVHRLLDRFIKDGAASHSTPKPWMSVKQSFA